MSEYTLNEAFRMAEQNEKRAAEYYRRAARQALQADARDVLGQIAKMEEAHQAYFARLLQQGGQAAIEDPYGDVHLYLTAIAKAHGGEGSDDFLKAMESAKGLKDMLSVAINAEAQSVLFYVGIRDAISQAADRAELDKIIAEERRHVVMIQRMLDGLAG